MTEDSFKITNTAGHKTPSGITSWRGSQLHSIQGIPFLPTYHPAGVLRQWANRYDLVHDLKARVKKAFNGTWEAPEVQFQIRPRFDEVIFTLNNLLESAARATEPFILSCDLETRRELIGCIGLGWTTTSALCIPFFYPGDLSDYWSEQEEIEIVLLLRKLLEHENVYLTGQNFLYDLQYLVLYLACMPKVAGDTMVMHHLCWPGKPKGLGYIASLYNAWHSYWKEEGKIIGSVGNPDEHWNYNCKDCITTYEAYFHLKNLIRHLGLEAQAEIQNQQIPMILQMMLRGVKIDLKYREVFRVELDAQIKERIKWLEDMLIPEVYPRKPKASHWCTSPKQQAEIFYEIFGVKPIKNKKTGNLTCDDEALEIIIMREPILRPYVQRIQELRSMKIFHKNFVLAELDEDERMRCTFDPTGANTFRWSASKNAFGKGTNLQTIPKGVEKD